MIRIPRPLLALTSALALLAGLGCGRDSKPGPYRGAPVILISIDTLRADHLPAWGYRGVETPAISTLAADGVLFENAYSHCPLTLPSHVSVLSGLLPPDSGVRDNMGYSFDAGAHPDLPSILASAGYDTGGFVSSFVLRGETGIAAGFATYDGDIPLEPGGALDSAQRSGAVTAEHAIAWLRQRADKPFFLFLHLYEPHTPWRPPEPYKSRYPDSPYDGEIAAADAIVGNLLAELRTLGLYDRSIVALLGDHGEGLGDHGEMHHGVMLYRSTLHVPLIVKLPRGARRGTRMPQPVGLVDVAPTLLDLAGVPGSTPFDGRSLFAAVDPERTLYAETYFPRLHYGWSDLKAVYDQRWSLVDGPTPELFDLATDPGQQRSVLLDNRRELARLREVVARTDRPLAEPEAVDAEAASKLAALGYLSGPPVRTTGDLPDPRTQLDQLEPIERGIMAYNAEDFTAAAAAFRAVLDANPKMYDIWLFYGRALQKTGDDEGAIHAWEKALDLSGGSSTLVLTLASAQMRLRRYDDVRALAATILAAKPKEANDLLAQADLEQGREAAAMARMEEAAREGRLTERMAYHLALDRLGKGTPRAALELLAPFEQEGEAPTLVAYGLALSDLGRQEEALAALERARRADDSLPKLHEALGIVLLRLDRAPEARVELERAIALNDRLVDSWNTLGVALFRLEGPRAAIGAWKRAIALDPNQFEALFNLGLVAAQAGEREEARRALRSFVARAPADRFGDDIARARAALAQLGG